RDPQVLEETPLPLVGAAAVAAHRGDEQGVGPRGPQLVHHGAQDRHDVADPPAPRGYRDTRPRAKPRSEIEPAQFGPDGGRDVVEAGPGESLVHPDHAGHGRGQANPDGNALDTDRQCGAPEGTNKIPRRTAPMVSSG